MLEYSPTKNIQSEPSTPDFGLNNYYFTASEPISWQKCRETFADRFTSASDGFYFGYKLIEGVDISDRIYSFIRKTEDILKINVDLEYTKFSKTNRPYALWIEPSNFWRECECRRSLLTILVRCGAVYIDNYEEALFSPVNGSKGFYTKDTVSAIKRFLFGFTNFNKGTNTAKGWVNIFVNKNKEDIKLLLSRTYSVNNKNNYYSVGSIWG